MGKKLLFYIYFLETIILSHLIFTLSASYYSVVLRLWLEGNRTETQVGTFFIAADEDCSNLALRKKDFLGHKCLICEIQFKFEFVTAFLPKLKLKILKNLQS